MLDRVQSLHERLARLDRHGLLHDDGAAVEPLVDEVDGDARGVDSCSERVVDRVRPRELR